MSYMPTVLNIHSKFVISQLIDISHFFRPTHSSASSLSDNICIRHPRVEIAIGAKVTRSCLYLILNGM